MTGFFSRFSPSETHRILFSQTGVQLLGKAITALASFLVLRMITSRSGIGSNGFGEYAIITGYATYFYLLIDFGLNAIFVRDSYEQPDRAERMFGQLLGLRLTLSIGFMALGLALLSFMPATYTSTIKLGIIATLVTILLQGIFVTCNALFQFKLRYDLSVAAAVAAAIINLAATYLVLRFGWGLFGVIVAYIVEYVVLVGMGLPLVRRFVAVRLGFDWRDWWKLLLAASSLGLTMVFNIFYFRSDAFLLSVLPLDARLHLGNYLAVSLYVLPYSIFENVLVVPTFLMNAAYPLMLRAHKTDVRQLRPLLRMVLIWALVGSVGLVVVIWVLAPWIMNLQSNGNPDFGPSAWTLRWLGLGLPVFFVSNVLVWALMTMRRHHWLPVVYGLAAIFNVGANLWLIPHYGYIAAAITTGLTEALIVILLMPQVWSGLASLERSEEPMTSAGEVVV